MNPAHVNAFDQLLDTMIKTVCDFTVFCVILVLYFAPWLLAYVLDRRRQHAIGLLNLCLGWTLVGWVVAFLWAYQDGSWPSPSILLYVPSPPPPPSPMPPSSTEEDSRIWERETPVSS